MCLDNPEEIIAELQGLKDARALREKWTTADKEDFTGPFTLDVSQSEGLRVIDQRIAEAEERIRRLGFTGKIVAADLGDSQRIMAGR
jgi:hypothetical protein